MDFSLMFFAAARDFSASGQYRLVMDLSERAEVQGFNAVWLPERHLDAFGGAFPNPLMLMAAVAARTTAIEVRAGSLVSPLHDTVRLFEDWSLLDNLTEGRSAVSFGSGWNADDFIFAPELFEGRREYMWTQIREVTDMWKGAKVRRVNGAGSEIDVLPLPRPYSDAPNLWVTNSGSPETTKRAARAGASLLTHMIGKDFDDIAAMTRLYRDEFSAGPSGQRGKVAVMLHACMTEDAIQLDRAKAALREYLRTAVNLENRAAEAAGTISGGHRAVPQDLNNAIIEELLDLSVERTLATSMVGTPDFCADTLRRAADAGVDEICCLVDFGVTREDAFRTLSLPSVLTEMQPS